MYAAMGKILFLKDRDLLNEETFAFISGKLCVSCSWSAHFHNLFVIKVQKEHLSCSIFRHFYNIVSYFRTEVYFTYVLAVRMMLHTIGPSL